MVFNADALSLAARPMINTFLEEKYVLTHVTANLNYGRKYTEQK